MTAAKTLWLLFGTALVFVLVNGAAIDLEGEIDAKNEYEKFFKKLTEEEKYAVMSMSIANYKYTGESSNTTGLFPTNPIPRPLADEIPRSLYTTMLNGAVPKNFMKKFNKWLKREFRLTDSSFERFITAKTGNSLCRDAEGNDCILIADAGSQCCPFG